MTDISWNIFHMNEAKHTLAKKGGSYQLYSCFCWANSLKKGKGARDTSRTFQNSNSVDLTEQQISSTGLLSKGDMQEIIFNQKTITKTSKIQ